MGTMILAALAGYGVAAFGVRSGYRMPLFPTVVDLVRAHVAPPSKSVSEQLKELVANGASQDVSGR